MRRILVGAVALLMFSIFTPPPAEACGRGLGRRVGWRLTHPLGGRLRGRSEMAGGPMCATCR